MNLVFPSTVSFSSIQKIWARGNVEPHMRWSLFNWLFDICSKDVMNIHVSGIRLCFSLIDRYMESLWLKKVTFTKQQLQVVGVTCLVIASKLSCTELPQLKNFVYYMDSKHTINEVLETEAIILSELDYILFKPVPVSDRAQNLLLYYETFYADDDKQKVIFSYLYDLVSMGNIIHKYCISELIEALFDLSHVIAEIANQKKTKILARDLNNQCVRDVLAEVKDEVNRIESNVATALERKYKKIIGCTITETLPAVRGILQPQNIPSKILTRTCAKNNFTVKLDDSVPANVDTNGQVMVMQKRLQSKRSLPRDIQRQTEVDSFKKRRQSQTIPGEKSLESDSAERDLMFNRQKTKTRCHGKTQGGKRCKKRPQINSKFCKDHNKGACSSALCAKPFRGPF